MKEIENIDELISQCEESKDKISLQIDFLLNKEIHEKEISSLTEKIGKLKLLKEKVLNEEDINIKEEISLLGFDYIVAEEAAWKRALKCAIKQIKEYVPKDNKKEAIKGTIEIRDGIIYADVYSDVFKLDIKLVPGNFLVLNEDGLNPRFLIFSSDGWFQQLDNNVDIDKLEIKKIN